MRVAAAHKLLRQNQRAASPVAAPVEAPRAPLLARSPAAGLRKRLRRVRTVTLRAFAVAAILQLGLASHVRHSRQRQAATRMRCSLLAKCACRAGWPSSPGGAGHGCRSGLPDGARRQGVELAARQQGSDLVSPGSIPVRPGHMVRGPASLWSQHEQGRAERSIVAGPPCGAGCREDERL